MKNKLLLPVIVGVAVIAGLGVFVALSGTASNLATNAKSNKTEHSKSADKHYKPVKACDVFTIAEAKTVLGDASTKSDVTAPDGSDNVTIDACRYTNNETEAQNIKIVTVVVRSAKDRAGTNSNSDAFEAGGTANANGSEEVSGYGEKAYWDPSLKQLAILQDHGHQWISVTIGGANTAENSLADAKVVADLIEN